MADETVGDLIARVGKDEAFTTILAYNIDLRVAACDAAKALCDALDALAAAFEGEGAGFTATDPFLTSVEIEHLAGICRQYLDQNPGPPDYGDDDSLVRARRRVANAFVKAVSG